MLRPPPPPKKKLTPFFLLHLGLADKVRIQDLGMILKLVQFKEVSLEQSGSHVDCKIKF